MQTADNRLFKYISCYFQYRVVTVSRVVPGLFRLIGLILEILVSLGITLARLNIAPVSMSITHVR